MSKCSKCCKKHDQDRHCATNFPEVSFCSGCVHNASKIHAIVGREEAKGKEDDGHDGKNHDGFFLRIADDGHFVLLNGAELKKLQNGQRKNKSG